MVKNGAMIKQLVLYKYSNIDFKSLNVLMYRKKHTKIQSHLQQFKGIMIMKVNKRTSNFCA